MFDKKAIVTTVLSSLLVSGLTWGATTIWPTIDGYCAIAWRFLCDEVSLPNWFVLGMIAFMAFLLWVIWAYVETSDNTSPWYESYKRDTLFNVLWRWRWTDAAIENLIGYCPDCDSRLIYDTYHPVVVGPTAIALVCEHCNMQIKKTFPYETSDEVAERIKREIMRKVRQHQKRRNQPK